MRGSNTHLRSCCQNGALLLLLFVLSTSVAVGQVLPFVSYTPGEDPNSLPSAEVQSTFQDSLGYIWMAVYSSGLVRYNGHSNDLYTTEDGLRHPEVLDMVSDYAGRLWVSSTVGLSVTEEPLEAYMDGAEIRFTTQLGGVDLLDISVRQNALAVDKLGRIWAGTNSEGIVRYTYQPSGEVIADTIRTAVDAASENTVVRTMTVGQDGTVWAGLSGGKMLAFQEGTDVFEEIMHEPRASSQSLDVLYESPDGKLWGGTNEGALMQLSNENGTQRMRIVLSDLGSNIFSIVSTDTGMLWMATEGSGLIAFDPDANTPPQIYTRASGLLGENVHHVMLDREDNLWVSQSGGVSKLRFDHDSFFHYTANSYAGEQPLLPAPTISSFIVPEDDGACHLWVGSLDGGIGCVQENASSTFIQEKDGLRSNRVSALSMDENGNLWVGTFSGINGISFNARSTLPPSAQTTTFSFNGARGRIAGYRGTSIHSIANRPLATGEQGTATTESLWFPGFKSIYLLVQNEWYTFRASSGLPATTYNVVELDDEGHLWVGTNDQGVFRSTAPISLALLKTLDAIDQPFSFPGRSGIFGQEITSPLFEEFWSVSTGGPTNDIQALRWHEGDMWVGTPEGIFALHDGDPSQLQHLSVKDGLRSNNVNSMDFSPVTGSLWAGTIRGLLEVDPERKEVIRHVTKQDGLIDEESWFYGSTVVDQQGVVYYGTARGATIYAPEQDKVNQVIPKLQIHKTWYTENGRGGNEFEVEYAGLSFVNEKQVRYRTRLLGYETSWTPETQDHKIRYTNLPAFFNNKTYTFEVQASNNNGLWTEEPRAFSFVVKPPIWLRSWALFIYAFGIVGLLYITDRVQRARLIKQERARAEKEKASELQSINKELQEALDHLTETRDQLIHAEKMASMGQLTSGIAHEIKNPLNFINNFASLNLDLTEDILSLVKDRTNGKGPENIAHLQELLNDLNLNSERIKRYGERADHIVESMMWHARTQPARKELTDFNTFVEQYIGIAYHSMQVQATEFESLIEQHYDPEIGELAISTQDFCMVLLNLYQNAFQTMHEKKEANAEYQPLLKVHTRKLKDVVELRVQDNGLGISEDEQVKIFEPFYSTRPSGSGIGLGLSISYDIVVHGHAGTLTVESAVGEGSTMIVRLPAA